MKSHVHWFPAVAVATAGAVAWAGAFTDNDAFGHRAHSIAVVLAFAVSLLGWIAKRRWLPLALALAAKLAVLFAYVPAAGFATLSMSYAEVRGDPKWLDYFWYVPPLMLAVTLVECWWLGVLASSRRLVDTRLFRHRKVIVPVAVGLVVAGGAWWLVRTPYYLWRMRAHDHGPSEHSLREVGPRALPAIYSEIDALGRQPAGPYRSSLVDVIRDIRHDVVAARIGSVLISDVEAAYVEPDRAMVQALIRAVTHEPDGEHRRSICNWMSELDFNTAVDVFCGSFADLAADTRRSAMSFVEGHARRATEPHTRSQRDNPWRRLNDDEVAKIQAAMKERLACAVPLLLDVLEQSPDDGDHPWMAHAIELVGRLSPPQSEPRRRLAELLPRVSDPYLLGRVLEAIGPPRLEDDTQRALLAKAYGTNDETHYTVARWAAASERGVDRFFCEVFPKAPEQDHFMLLEMLWTSVDPASADRCLGTVLMRGYEAVENRWSGARREIEAALEKLAPHDERIAPWAAALADEPEYQASSGEALRRLAGRDAPQPATAAAR